MSGPAIRTSLKTTLCASACRLHCSRICSLRLVHTPVPRCKRSSLKSLASDIRNWEAGAETSERRTANNRGRTCSQLVSLPTSDRVRNHLPSLLCRRTSSQSTATSRNLSLMRRTMIHFRQHYISANYSSCCLDCRANGVNFPQSCSNAAHLATMNASLAESFAS